MATTKKIRNLEPEDFRIDSSEWRTLPNALADWRPVRINPFGDVFEITLPDGTPVQLFTHAAALREVAAANRRLPTLSVFRSLTKITDSSINRLNPSGCLVGESFEEVGSTAYYWAHRTSTASAPGFRIDLGTGICFEVFDYDRSFCFAVRCVET